MGVASGCSVVRGKEMGCGVFVISECSLNAVSHGMTIGGALEMIWITLLNSLSEQVCKPKKKKNNSKITSLHVHAQ